MKSIRESGEYDLDPSVSALFLSRDSVQAPSGSASIWLVVCGLLISDRNDFTLVGDFESTFFQPGTVKQRKDLG